MRILEIEIEEFGKLCDLSLRPAPGMTLIEGENESGKSTVLAFLRFALYGFPRKGSAEGEERERRLSWRSRRASGCLTLEWRGQTYRIFRKCMLTGGVRESVAEELAVVLLPQGEPVELMGKSPGEYFLGLPAELYDGSMFLAQSGAARVCAPGMGDAVGELLFTGDAVLSAEAAEKRLQDARRELQHLKGNGGLIAELEGQLSALDEALAGARTEHGRLAAARTERARCEEALAAHRRALQEVDAALACTELDRILALFDARAEAMARLAQCGGEVEQIRDKARTELPPAELAERMGEAAGELRDAEKQIAAAASEVERLSCAGYDKTLLEGAAALDSMPNADELPARAAAYTAKRKRCTVYGVLCLLLAAGAAAAGLLLSAWREYAVAGACLAACFALVLLCGAWGSGQRLKRLLKRVGAGSAVMLRTHIAQCRREQQRYAEERTQRERAEAVLAQARADRERALEDITAALASLGREDVAPTCEGVAAYLTWAKQRERELQAAFSRASIAYERAESAAATLSGQLEGKDERALRAERAAFSDGAVDPNALTQRRGALEREIAELEEKYTAAGRTEAALAVTARDPDGLEREKGAVCGQLEAARRRLAAIRLAQEALQQAGEELRRSLIPRLRDRAAEIFTELTDGTHGALHLTSDLSITVVGDGMPRPLSHYSTGCRDAAYLALRLALLDVLCEERLPLLLDEAFADLDDARTARLLQVLHRYCEGGGQAILLTCHTREAGFLAGYTDVQRLKMPK